MKFDKSRVRPGMTAISTRGETLGKVARSDDQSFIIEKGTFFPKDYLLRYEYITDVRGDQLLYALEEARVSESDLKSAASAPVATAASVGAVPAAGTGIAERARAAVGRVAEEVRERRELKTDVEADGEIRMALRDDEITVEKVNRETGHVRIHKAVRTEERHITVPVTREEVVVERVPADRSSSLSALEEPFEERDIDLTVHEEEIRVSTHPVVREEVRVRRVAHEEQRDASATLRHEEVRVEDTTPERYRAARRG